MRAHHLGLAAFGGALVLAGAGLAVRGAIVQARGRDRRIDLLGSNVSHAVEREIHLRTRVGFLEQAVKAPRAEAGSSGMRDEGTALVDIARARLLAARAEAVEIENAASRPPPADRGVADLGQWVINTAEPGFPLVTLTDREGRSYTFAAVRAQFHDLGRMLTAATGPNAEARWMSVRAHLDRALDKTGSTGRLAHEAGVSARLIQIARKAGRCSPPLALAIEAATGVPRAGLCPASFGAAASDPRAIQAGRRALAAHARRRA